MFLNLFLLVQLIKLLFLGLNISCLIVNVFLDQKILTFFSKFPVLYYLANNMFWTMSNFTTSWTETHTN